MRGDEREGGRERERGGGGGGWERGERGKREGELAVETSSSLQCREVVQRVSLLMNVVSVYQFTDGIQVCCVQDKLEAAGLMWYINSLRKLGRKILFQSLRAPFQKL